MVPGDYFLEVLIDRFVVDTDYGYGHWGGCVCALSSPARMMCVFVGLLVCVFCVRMGWGLEEERHLLGYRKRCC